MSPITASIIVTCKGRLEHLKQTIPHMLAQRCGFPYEVLVVDYGDPAGAFSWCHAQNQPLLGSVRVLDDVEWFNLSRARNCGAVHACGKVLAFLDADLFLAPTWLATAVPLVAEGPRILAYCEAHPAWSAVRTRVFHAVRGFDESLRGWGYEDIDFNNRCLQHGSLAPLDCGLITQIKHGDADRVGFYHNKRRWRSFRSNLAACQQRSGPVNAQGYGVGQCEIWRHPARWEPQQSEEVSR